MNASNNNTVASNNTAINTVAEELIRVNGPLWLHDLVNVDRRGVVHLLGGRVSRLEALGVYPEPVFEDGLHDVLHEDLARLAEELPASVRAADPVGALVVEGARLALLPDDLGEAHRHRLQATLEANPCGVFEEVMATRLVLLGAARSMRPSERCAPLSPEGRREVLRYLLLEGALRWLFDLEDAEGRRYTNANVPLLGSSVMEDDLRMTLRREGRSFFALEFHEEEIPREFLGGVLHYNIFTHPAS